LQGLGGGELSPSVCPGVGNIPPGKKKIANARGGMVTGQIEPCITAKGKREFVPCNQVTCAFLLSILLPPN